MLSLKLLLNGMNVNALISRKIATQIVLNKKLMSNE
jgi:hypothetical protein